jgi:hypothetical protein
LIRSRAKRTPWPHGLAATSAAPIAVRFPAHLPRVDVTITPEDGGDETADLQKHCIEVLPPGERTFLSRRSAESGQK